MMGLPIYRDFDGTYKVEGYEEFSFSTEEDARQAGQVAIHYFVDRHSVEMANDSRYRRAAQRAKA